MPFDGADYRPSGREVPKRSTNTETALLYAIAIFATVMLLMPISLGALADIVRYLQGP